KIVFEMLFYILFYINCYLTFYVLGALFSDILVAYRRIQQLLSTIEKTIENTAVLPKREIKSMKELFKTFPKIKDFFVDGTKQPVYKPKDKYEQKDNYSGKKKRHTIKNTIIVTEKKEILYLFPTNGGKKHNFRVFKEELLSNKEMPLPVVGILLPLNNPRIWLDLDFLA
ncbi:MAG: transposase family protein, partial [Candidatus Altarchaeum sp.]|nr:transposase family protein [Candidatus Altarchaeum sp.]